MGRKIGWRLSYRRTKNNYWSKLQESNANSEAQVRANEQLGGTLREVQRGTRIEDTHRDRDTPNSPKQAGRGPQAVQEGAPSNSGDESTLHTVYKITGMSTRRSSYAEDASKVDIPTDRGYSGCESSGENSGESSGTTTKRAEAAPHDPQVQNRHPTPTTMTL